MSEGTRSSCDAAVRLSMKHSSDISNSEPEAKRLHTGHFMRNVVMLLDDSDVSHTVEPVSGSLSPEGDGSCRCENLAMVTGRGKPSRSVYVNTNVWCIFINHPHLTIIPCCTVVWALVCGLYDKTSFVIFLHLRFIQRPQLFLPRCRFVGGAVSRYCYFCYILFGPSQLFWVCW